MASKISTELEESGAEKRLPDGADLRILETVPSRLSLATGDVCRILMICQIFYETSCNFNNMPLYCK